MALPAYLHISSYATLAILSSLTLQSIPGNIGVSLCYPVELSSIPGASLFVLIVLGASFPADHCSCNASIYKVLVICISFAIVEAERLPALYRLVSQMNYYLSCKLFHRFFDQHLQTVLSVER